MIKATETANKNSQDVKKVRNRLFKEIRILIKKREELKRVKRNTKNKIEYNLTCKLVKIKIRNFLKDEKLKKIREILETAKSTKKLKNNK